MIFTVQGHGALFECKVPWRNDRKWSHEDHTGQIDKQQGVLSVAELSSHYKQHVLQWDTIFVPHSHERLFKYQVPRWNVGKMNYLNWHMHHAEWMGKQQVHVIRCRPFLALKAPCSALGSTIAYHRERLFVCKMSKQNGRKMNPRAHTNNTWDA